MNTSESEYESEAVISLWEDSLRLMQAEQARLISSGLWVSGVHDLLSIIGRPRHEVYHTAILAWLLDPSMPHGLGTKFLSRLLQRCFPDLALSDADLAGAVAQAEVYTARCRADVVVWSPKATIIIEAKVDAPERRHQCEDLYGDYFGEINPRFIFLSPAGRPPRTANAEALEAFVSISFRDVRMMLEIAVDQEGSGQVAAGRPSALAYLATLREVFP